MISVIFHMLSFAVAGWAFYAVFKSVTADDGQVRFWWGASLIVALLNLWLMFTFMRGN